MNCYIALILVIIASVSVVTSAVDCIDDLSVIFLSQFDANASLIPVGQHQVFILCPDTEYAVGYLDEKTSEIFGGQLPISLRSNMTILCGEDGKSSNNCNITTGSIGLITVIGQFGEEEYTIENTVISGITFSESIRDTYFVIGGLGGNIDVIDCRFYGGDVYEFVVLYSTIVDLQARKMETLTNQDQATTDKSVTTSPAKRFAKSIKDFEKKKHTMKEHAKNRRLERLVDDRYYILDLNVTFTDCLFQDNKIATPLLYQGDYERFMIALIIGAESVMFKNTTFINNDWVSDLSADSGMVTALVGSLSGGNIEFDSCCFIDNKVIGNGYAIATAGPYPVVTRPVTALNTFAPKNEGQECAFAWFPDAVFNGTFSFGDITCIDGGRTDECAVSAHSVSVPVNPTSAPVATSAPSTSEAAENTPPPAPVTPPAPVAPPVAPTRRSPPPTPQSSVPTNIATSSAAVPVVSSLFVMLLVAMLS